MTSIYEDLVTVIIPTYNRAHFINEALNSVFAQIYRNFEIIVVDDGSTDETSSILNSLRERGLIRYIFQEHQGVSAARNRGIAESKGKYIAFLDSDDLFEPEKLEIQVEYMLNHPEVGLVHSGYTKFDNEGNNLGYRDTSWFSNRIYPQILLYWTTLIAINTVLVPKKVFDSVGRFDESLHIGEDLNMWRCIARKYPFGFINKSLARVRFHQGNTSGDKLSATTWFIKYLELAFKDDPDLSLRFRKRAYSRLFSNMAYNLLSEIDSETLRFARQNAHRAIVEDPTNIHGYMALLFGLIGGNIRPKLIRFWRSVRAFFMARNRLN